MTSTVPLAIFWLSGVLAAGSCNAESPTVPAAGEEFQLAIGESATPADGGGVTVTFADVTGDSRCPTGVTCIWAGEVTIALDLAAAGQAPTRVELTAGPDATKASAALDGHTLHLLRVDPYPKAGKPIERSQYRATLRLERELSAPGLGRAQFLPSTPSALRMRVFCASSWTMFSALV